MVTLKKITTKFFEKEVGLCCLPLNLGGTGTTLARWNVVEMIPHDSGGEVRKGNEASTGSLGTLVLEEGSHHASNLIPLRPPCREGLVEVLSMPVTLTRAPDPWMREPPGDSSLQPSSHPNL